MASSRRERRLWLLTFATLAAIYSTLALSPLLLSAFAGADLAAVVFMAGVILVAAALLALALGNRNWRLDTPSALTRAGIAIGVAAVYLLVLARLASAAERTHLIEYSVLAALIREALVERAANGRRVRVPSLVAFGGAILAGAIDEGIQWFVPSRSFDHRDLLFNVLAAAMGVGASAALGGWRGTQKSPSATHKEDKSHEASDERSNGASDGGPVAVGTVRRIVMCGAAFRDRVAARVWRWERGPWA